MSVSDPGVDLSTVPVYPPPPGVTPNFINPPSLATLSFVLFPILLGISFTFVTFRIIFNYRSIGTLKADDSGFPTSC